MDRRLLLAWAFVPVAFYAYACSSDDEATPPAEQDGGASSSGGSSGGGSSGNASSSGGQNDGGDPDGGNPLTCIGNPLAEDAGTGDAGAFLSSDGGPLTLLVNTGTANQNFLDGPQYTDLLDGGALVYSEVYGAVRPRIVAIAASGGTPTEIRVTPGNDPYLLPIGNAIKGTSILTAVARPAGGNTGQTAGILTTSADGGAGPKIDVPAAVDDPNDLVVTKDGIVFFTDPAYQSGENKTGIYRVNTDGGVDEVKGYDGDRPDGIALSPDDKILYVAFGAAGKRIERFDVGPNGATTVANPATLPATFIDDPEGIAVDSAGNIWVAESVRPTNGDNPQNGGRVEVFAPDGKKHGEIAFPGHRPIAVAFGGADNKTVFIVANANATNGTGGGGAQASYSGSIFKFTSRCAGTR